MGRQADDRVVAEKPAGNCGGGVLLADVNAVGAALECEVRPSFKTNGTPRSLQTSTRSFDRSTMRGVVRLLLAQAGRRRRRPRCTRHEA